MSLSLLTIDKDPSEKKGEGQGFIMYKEICSLCNGNGYITIPVEGHDEIKQCWLCESNGEKECDTNTQ
tara:strand:- start:225 stop:428 length:204 start_codon:yes stop_codon:yes gene_type:complete